MADKTQGRTGGHRPTPKSACHQHFTVSSSRVTTFLTTLAVWGLLPARLVEHARPIADRIEPLERRRGRQEVEPTTTDSPARLRRLAILNDTETKS